MRLCGEVMKVDVVAPGNRLPFPNKSVDFVISSHVLEHFFNPLSALQEWSRVARQFVFVIIPHRAALPSDADKPITPIYELLARYTGEIADPGTDDHHTRWTMDSFHQMCELVGMKVLESHERDDKVGNGHLFVLTPNWLVSHTFTNAAGSSILSA